ncbi:MAG: ABC transporter permease, partial [Candidatus Angelobacter sp.]
MTGYILRRTGRGLVLIFGVSLLLFAIQQATPGEFLNDARLNSQISQETLAGLRAQYGLDRPLPVRYLQ